MGVLGVVGLAAGGMISGNASTPDPLPETTAAELVADVQASSTDGFSGTVVAQMSLGLPELPALAGEGGSSPMLGLVSGSHTMRVWYGGPDKQRLALLGPTSETDVFHSGADVWQWDSESHIATHTVVSKAETHASRPAPTSTESLSPTELGKQVLGAIDPTTKVELGATRTVADRSTYVLVLTPRDSATRVGSVRIAVDGSTKLPLSVQVFPRDSSAAAIDVAFTDISFKAPPSGYFRFTPPPGATVKTGGESTPAIPKVADGASTGKHGDVTTVGKGWTTVVEYHASTEQIRQLAGPALGKLSPVSGAWGRGRLLTSALVSALVTDDGRVFAGAVDPAALYAAASAH